MSLGFSVRVRVRIRVRDVHCDFEKLVFVFLFFETVNEFSTKNIFN